MILVDYLPHLMLIVLALLLMSGFPVGAILAGVGVGFGLLGVVIGEYPVQSLFLIPSKIYMSIGENLTYPAVPMLLFMGVALEVSGAARELLLCLQRILGRAPGSMCVSVILIGLLLAPLAGVIGASVATIAAAALPTMMAQRYRPEVASGVIAAAGTLGVIAPPAIMLFFLSDAMELTIGSMFLAPILPILCLAGAFICYFIVVDVLRPRSGAAAMPSENGRSILIYLIRSLVLPVGLIALVLGSIVAGWVSPTESAAVGAIGGGAMIFLYRGFDLALLRQALVRTMVITGMVFFVVLGAGIFSLVFRFYGGDDIAIGLFEDLSIGDFGVLAVVLIILFVLGFFIDWIEITLVSLPILYPAISQLDFSAYVGSEQLARLWIGALVALVLQTSFLTPPFGFALFFLKGAAPDSIRMAQIYRGVIPLVAIQLLMIAAVLMFPALVTILPKAVLGI
ncbi:TRAP transporter large permease [Nisaea nitritireducens]|uniref:TRAP transporter large permease n=1 Tax=Nisaea nitritireducens TaxID=568392 RepID=UPI001868B05C|nr:TRAP transporter large permease subunit [Nisaea nitritireducens]|tara:strand:- start:7461 stop:8822 length:1362 start_codon:yes stop_codon:yes gene_type:complete